MSPKPPSFLASPKGLNQLKAAKDRLNLSVAAIAEQAGVSADTVRRLFHPERGKRVSQPSIEAIAQTLGLSPAAIVPAGEWPIESADNAPLAEAEKRIQAALKSGSTELDLSNLGLTTVPQSIGQLSNLTVLDLSQNQLTEVPKELGQLSKLTVLSLSQNQLTEVPKELGQLSKLTVLSLSQNQLTEVPKELGQLSKLTVLDLSQNQLTEVPKELGQLSKLTVLFLSQNQLTEVPKELGQLSKL
ncbi:MAG: helix-turn-helix domain-containing protein, partial [Cyanothece sp. SIO1E1]|nr:helix-turn-helix domain-containing protein [Cyanothece sp. SIO1E1]